MFFMELLNEVAPLKTKFLRASHSKFVTKYVSKAIMLRTKQRNQFLSLVKKAKRNYYENL